MKFMIIRKADADTEAGTMPSEQQFKDMIDYNGELVNAGAMLAAEGLQPSSKGARVKFSSGKPTVIDGPFAETKELIAGYTMIQAASLQDALEWVKRWPSSDGGGDALIEVRQVYVAEDFGAEFTPELREQVEKQRAKAAAKPIKVHAYLSFDGTCKEAFEFYARCFGGHVESSFTYGGSPMADQVGPDAKDRIMHSRLNVGDSMFMGSDAFPGSYEAPRGNWVSLGLQDPAESDRIFGELAEGGRIVMPIQLTFWAARFGMVVDRFGIPWMINCEQPAS